VAFLAFFLFQYAFADTCSTVTTGAMVGRTAFGGDLLYSVMVSGFIYPILGHWIWGPDGWMATMKTPFHDFAGSTVVHSIGGFIALAGAIALGPRLGRKFKRDGGGMPPGHDMAIAAVGGVILWFGWYGFNPGSTLSAMDFEGIGRVATNTTLAASAAGLVAMFVAYPRAHKWDTGISINGFLAGLVAITCPCYWVSPFGAICIGAVAGVVVIVGIDLLEYIRIDDPIGAWPVHGLCGMWGTISLGLFATGQYGAATSTGPDASSAVKGLFYGGGTHQLVVQILGSLLICSVTFVIALGIMYAIKAMGILRISPEHEIEGLDKVEHGAPAYHPEYAYMGYSPLPPGLPPGPKVPAGAGAPAISVGQ
jgi:Amt family ammonium transporter